MNKPIVYLSMLTLASSCAGAFAGQVEPAIGLNDDLGLVPAELARLKIAAASGDPAAGRRVALYFDFAAKDVPSALDWYKVAAENGDRSSACRLAITYKNDLDLVIRTRAAFWKRKCDWSDKAP
jgi:hypothetical protein